MVSFRQLLRDVGSQSAAATVELASAAFNFDACGVRSVGGVILNCVLRILVYSSTVFFV